MGGGKKGAKAAKPAGGMSAKEAAAAALKVDQSDPMEQANKDAGANHLLELSGQPGWHALSSGVLFKIKSLGRVHAEQMSPNMGSEVSVHYTGRLIDGTKFDSTGDRGAPLVCKPSQVIKGWGECLTLMGEGDTWDVAIPWHQAYGKDGAGKEGAVPIPPYAALMFNITLRSITRVADGGDGAKKKGPSIEAPRPAAEAREELAGNVEKPYEALFVAEATADSAE